MRLKRPVPFNILMDKIIYDGKEYILHSTPMDELWEMENYVEPEFKVISYLNWRGYQAAWEIKDKELFLLEIRSRDRENPVKLIEIFPDNKGQPVKAFWYTGTLCLLAGNCVRLMPYGYGSTFETEIYITVKKGEVFDKSVKHFSREDFNSRKQITFN